MRAIGAWMLYGIGDLWCELFVVRGLGYFFSWPYHVYNRLVRWSVDLQGAGKGPWKAEQETQHLLRSPANAKVLDEAIADAEAGKVIESEFEQQMRIARGIMKQRRDALHELAKR